VKDLRPGYLTGMDSRWAGVSGVAVLVGALMSGCGGGSGPVSAADAASLHREVDAIREAARAGNNDVAQSRVSDLRATVGDLVADGRLDSHDGMVLLTQVDRLGTRIDARPTPTPSPTPAVVVEAPATPRQAETDQGHATKGPKAGHKPKGHDK